MHFNTNLRKIKNSSAAVQVFGAMLIAMVLSVLLLQSRNLSREGEDPAFFVPRSQKHCWVEAQNRAGECQIYDVSVAASVAEMTHWIDAAPSQARLLHSLNFLPGQHIEIVYKNSGREEIEFSWMRAGKRLALGVLLHPDRMSILDWQDLKGIGPGLSNRIIEYRQNNGAFGVIDNVTRVSGIGRKTLESMRPWFIQPSMPQN